MVQNKIYICILSLCVTEFTSHRVLKHGPTDKIHHPAQMEMLLTTLNPLLWYVLLFCPLSISVQTELTSIPKLLMKWSRS